MKNLEALYCNVSVQGMEGRVLAKQCQYNLSFSRGLCIDLLPTRHYILLSKSCSPKKFSGGGHAPYILRAFVCDLDHTTSKQLAITLSLQYLYTFKYTPYM